MTTRRKWPIRLGRGHLDNAPAPGQQFGPGGGGGRYRFGWMYVFDANGDAWIEWFVFRWLSVQVLINPDPPSLRSAEMRSASLCKDAGRWTGP